MARVFAPKIAAREAITRRPPENLDVRTIIRGAGGSRTLATSSHQPAAVISPAS